MKVFMIGFIFLIFAFVLAAEAEDSSTVIEGEVIDLFCYSAHPDTAVGLSHAKCAQQCIAKGIPAGILTKDNVIYLALGADHGPANDMLLAYAGKVIKVEGKTSEVNNMKFIQIQKIEGQKENLKSQESEENNEHSGHAH